MTHVSSFSARKELASKVYDHEEASGASFIIISGLMSLVLGLVEISVGAHGFPKVRLRKRQREQVPNTSLTYRAFLSGFTSRPRSVYAVRD